MAARLNDKAKSAKALQMLRDGATMAATAKATGLSMGSMSYYRRKMNGKGGFPSSNRRRATGAVAVKEAVQKAVASRPTSSSADDFITPLEARDFARRLAANGRRWEKIAQILREME